jgi:hypothetical protein
VDSAEQGAPRLVVEHDHYAGVGEIVRVHLRLATDGRTTRALVKRSNRLLLLMRVYSRVLSTVSIVV